MSDAVSGYLQQISAALHGRKAVEIAALIALPHSGFTSDDRALASQVETSTDIAKTCYKSLRVDQPLSEAVSGRLSCLSALVRGEYDTAYKSIHAAFNSLLDFMGGNTDFPFLAGMLARLASDLRIIAAVADTHKAERERVSNPCLRECQNSITRGFTLIAKDRLPITDPACKKRYLFSITNTLFKIYFRLNTLQLMGKLIKLVDSPSVMANLKAFPCCDVVIYKFYVGRLNMFEDRLEDARECLRYALRYTPLSQKKNRQLILSSLVPIEMCQGILPNDALGKKYGLQVFTQLGNAVRVGNLRDFNNLFEENKPSFIKLGVYLVIEQLKGMVYRNLFKRFHVITDSTRISIETFQAVLRWLGEDVEVDEIECILANLIFQNKVKGYLSHQKRILVVGKNDPFPSASVIKRARPN